MELNWESQQGDLRLQLQESWRIRKEVATQYRGRDKKPEAEPSEVPVREIEVATTLLFKDPKGRRNQSLRSRPKETLNITKPCRNLKLRS